MWHPYSPYIYIYIFVFNIYVLLVKGTLACSLCVSQDNVKSHSHMMPWIIGDIRKSCGGVSQVARFVINLSYVINTLN
jgi:hypothetical protein